MFSGTYMKGILTAVATVAVTACAISGVSSIGILGETTANATPRTVVTGTLGIGERTVPPLEVPLEADAKIQCAEVEHPRTITRSAVRAMAPLPKPVATVRAAGGSTASRSTAASSGWSSARVSWYGPGFYGKSTASGAILTEGMMNVAHRSLAFGTQIQFEYNGRTCTAVVNDRGPYSGGRTFDLGPGTAQALGFSGVGTVKYRILGR